MLGFLELGVASREADGATADVVEVTESGTITAVAVDTTEFFLEATALALPTWSAAVDPTSVGAERIVGEVALLRAPG